MADSTRALSFALRYPLHIDSEGKQMDIMELGALGELVGAIGVVATLAYLSVQIRASTKATRSQTLQELHRDHRDVYQTNPEIHDALAKANAGEELTPYEQLMVGQLVGRTLRMYENQWYQHQIGALDDVLYRGYSRHIYISMSQLAFAAHWRRATEFYHPGFVEHVNTMLCDAPDWFDPPDSGEAELA